jgi:probable phosphoglycerate mutase
MSVSTSSAEIAYPQKGFQVPVGATDVLLIRHGQSAGMTASTYRCTESGQADPELSDKGHRQAAAMAERMSRAGIQALYTSTLIRTQQTAAPLASFTGLTPEVVPELREIELGDWEGGEFRRRLEQQDPMILTLMREGSWDYVPGGEGDAAFTDRVRAGLKKVVDAHPGERIAVVCHGGVIGAAIALATGCSPMAFMHVDNCSVSQLIVHEGLPIVRRVNDTAHLGPAFSQATDEPVM